MIILYNIRNFQNVGLSNKISGLQCPAPSKDARVNTFWQDIVIFYFSDVPAKPVTEGWGGGIRSHGDLGGVPLALNNIHIGISK